MANSSRDAWWRKEINEWLDKLSTPQNFMKQYLEACASYEWKQMAIEMACKRWPVYRQPIKKFKGQH